MITISILGLDQYVVGHYSKDHTRNLADLFEVDPDEVRFYAPSAFIFHAGVEQTSWDTLVRVLAPRQAAPLEDKVAKYLLRTLGDFSINVTVIFEYYDLSRRHVYRNDKYPRFLSEMNVAPDENEPEKGQDGDDEDDDGDGGESAN